MPGEIHSPNPTVQKATRQASDFFVAGLENSTPQQVVGVEHASDFVWLRMGLPLGTSRWPAGQKIELELSGADPIPVALVFLPKPQFAPGGGSPEGWVGVVLGGAKDSKLREGDYAEFRPKQGPHANGDFAIFALAAVKREDAKDLNPASVLDARVIVIQPSASAE